MCRLVTLYSSGHHISRTTEFMSRAVIGGWMLLCLLWRATLALRQLYISCSMAQPSSLPYNTYTSHECSSHGRGFCFPLTPHVINQKTIFLATLFGWLTPSIQLSSLFSPSHSWISPSLFGFTTLVGYVCPVPYKHMNSAEGHVRVACMAPGCLYSSKLHYRNYLLH